MSNSNKKLIQEVNLIGRIKFHYRYGWVWMWYEMWPRSCWIKWIQNSRHHQVKLYYIHSIIILMNERIPCMCVILEPIQSTSRIKTVLIICIQFCLNLLDYLHQINLVEKHLFLCKKKPEINSFFPLFLFLSSAVVLHYQLPLKRWVCIWAVSFNFFSLPFRKVIT